MSNKGSWAIGGGLMLGLGIGFPFIQTNIFAFVGCILGGIGVGLILSALGAKD